MEQKLTGFFESMIESKLYEKGYLLNDIEITDCDGLSYISGWCSVKPLEDTDADYQSTDFVFDFDGQVAIDTYAIPTNNDALGIMKDFNEFIEQYTGKEFE